MTIDRDAVDHVARLARLDLSDDERTRMQTELASILSHVENIQSLELDAIAPTSHALPLNNVMRPDAVGDCLTQEAALANGPEVEDGRFRVPRILEDE